MARQRSHWISQCFILGRFTARWHETKRQRCDAAQAATGPWGCPAARSARRSRGSWWCRRSSWGWGPALCPQRQICPRGSVPHGWCTGSESTQPYMLKQSPLKMCTTSPKGNATDLSEHMYNLTQCDRPFWTYVQPHPTQQTPLNIIMYNLTQCDRPLCRYIQPRPMKQPLWPYEIAPLTLWNSPSEPMK